MRQAILDGFGADANGEDRFDSVLGVLCVLNVLAGNRPDTAPADPWIERWEGWVLGQTAMPSGWLAVSDELSVRLRSERVDPQALMQLKVIEMIDDVVWTGAKCRHVRDSCPLLPDVPGCLFRRSSVLWYNRSRCGARRRSRSLAPMPRRRRHLQQLTYGGPSTAPNAGSSGSGVTTDSRTTFVIVVLVWRCSDLDGP